MGLDYKTDDRKHCIHGYSTEITPVCNNEITPACNTEITPANSTVFCCYYH